jgi:hypothetical protein
LSGSISSEGAAWQVQAASPSNMVQNILVMG